MPGFYQVVQETSDDVNIREDLRSLQYSVTFCIFSLWKEKGLRTIFLKLSERAFKKLLRLLDMFLFSLRNKEASSWIMPKDVFTVAAMLWYSRETGVYKGWNCRSVPGSHGMKNDSMITTSRILRFWKLQSEERL